MRRLIPPVLLGLCLILMALLDWKCRLFVIVRWPWNLLGLVPLAAAVAVGLAGLYEFMKARTTFRPFQEAAHLVTGGVYRYTRNPMYLADALGLIAAWILMGMHFAIVGVVIFVVVTDRWYIRVEEDMLLRKFGDEFRRYRSRTRRWI